MSLNEKLKCYLWAKDIRNFAKYTTVMENGKERISFWDEESLGREPTMVEIEENWKENGKDFSLYYKRKSAALNRSEFKLALLDRGELDNVKAAMDDSGADPRAVILWEDALHFHRTDPDLLRLANDLGYTDEQLDGIFGIS